MVIQTVIDNKTILQKRELTKATVDIISTLMLASRQVDVKLSSLFTLL